MMRPLLTLLSPAGPRAKLTTLIFHRVLREPDPMFPDEMHAARFDDICGWLASWFQVLRLEDAVARLQAGTLPARAVAITFDDGYEDNHSVAMPILQRHGLTATFFVATGFIDCGCMWNDIVIESARRSQLPALDAALLGIRDALPLSGWTERRQAAEAVIATVKYWPIGERRQVVMQLAERAGVVVPSTLMMNSHQVRDMYHSGMSIGAHTIDHPILARLTEEEIREQIEGSREFLRTVVGGDVDLFAYPNGKPGTDYTRLAVRVVRELGFAAAVSTSPGVAASSSDFFQLPRFTPWDRRRVRFVLRMAGNMMTIPDLVSS